MMTGNWILFPDCLGYDVPGSSMFMYVFPPNEQCSDGAWPTHSPLIGTWTVNWDSRVQGQRRPLKLRRSSVRLANPWVPTSQWEACPQVQKVGLLPALIRTCSWENTHTKYTIIHSDETQLRTSLGGNKGWTYSPEADGESPTPVPS